MTAQQIILFDGECNLCNGSVQFIIKRDKKGQIRFAPLQAAAARQLLGTQEVLAGELSTFVFIDNGKIYTRSTAALRVCRYLRGLWPVLYAFIVVPRFIRDGVYDWIAANRYKWFGHRQECMVPTPELKAKFLND